MKSWLRVTLPASQYAIIILAVYGVLLLFPLVLALITNNTVNLIKVRALAAIVTSVAAIVYGIYRVAAFHPACSRLYRLWLQQTPWRFGLPLPYGPPQLVLQDLFYVVLLTVLSLPLIAMDPAGLGFQAMPIELCLMIPIVFLGTYVTASLWVLFATNQHRHAFVIAMGLGGLFLLHQHIGILLSVLIVLYCVVRHGLQQSLRACPNWESRLIDAMTLTTGNQKATAFDILFHIGWPFDRLSPINVRERISLLNSTALAVLTGWWSFCVMFVQSDFLRATSLRACVSLALFFALIRAVIYLRRYTSPIDWFGRLKTFRWIIPRYDVALVAPLGIVIVTLVIQVLCNQYGISPLAGGPLIMTFAIFIACAAPPSLDRWRLTGYHRITPPGTMTADNYEQTK